MPRTLRDFGERRIIAEMLGPRYGSASPTFGDDCVAIQRAGGHIIVTTDPCPPPMAAALGFDDPYYRGWLLATINLSDLAAAGAEPLGLLTSLELPADTTTEAFERLLDGIDDCAARCGTSVLGGNLKEGTAISVAATAVGWCDSDPLTRKGARPGDVVFAVGDLGLFWSGALGVQRGFIPASTDEPMLRSVLTPQPKVAAGVALRRERVLSSAIDCSDGLWSSLFELGQASGICVVVDPAGWDYTDGVLTVAGQLGVDPVRLALGWGDWQLVATCAPPELETVHTIAAGVGAEVRVLGECEQGAGVDILHDGARAPLLALDSQRFAADSWFSAGLDTYVDRMCNGPLSGA